MPDLSGDADVLDAAAADLAISNPALSAALTEDALVLRQAADELAVQQDYIDTLLLFLPDTTAYEQEVSVGVAITATSDEDLSSPATSEQSVSVDLVASPEVTASQGARNTRVLVCVVSAMAVTEDPGIIHFTKSITVGDPQWLDRYSYSVGICPMGVEVEAVGP